MGLLGAYSPPARRAYVPVFKYRLKLVKSPVLGRRAKAVARQSAAHSAPACMVSQGRGGERAADVTPCPRKGWDVCWHRAGFVCRGHVELLPQGGGVWVCVGVRRRGGC